MELRGKKIAVTGAGGFIGSHLVERLIEEGCSIRAFVRYNSRNNWGWLESIDKNALRNVEIISGDMRDPHGVMAALDGIDVVFHLAALIGIPFSYVSPESYVETNIKGTLNVLQAARKSGCKKVLVTSTSEVYGTALTVPIDEKHAFQGQSPYSASKIGADRLAESFFRSFGLPVTIVRPFNTYGPRQSARAIIPTIITQILNGQKRIKLGSLHPTRDLVYVKDTVEGFVAIARSDATIGEEINIATQKETSMGDLAKKIAGLLKADIEIISDKERVRPEKSEVERLCGANAKISSLTGWKPSYGIEQGLEQTIKWFAEPGNRDQYKSDIYNL